MSSHHFHSVNSVIHSSLCWSVKCVFPLRSSRLLFVNISLTVFVFAGNISLLTPSSYSPATKITLGTVNANVGAQMVSVTQTHQCTYIHVNKHALHSVPNTQIQLRLFESLFTYFVTLVIIFDDWKDLK